MIHRITSAKQWPLHLNLRLCQRPASVRHTRRHDGWILYFVCMAYYTQLTKNYGSWSFFAVVFAPLFRNMMMRVRNATCAHCVCLRVHEFMLNKSADFLGFFRSLPSVLVCSFVLSSRPIYFAIICFYFNFVCCFGVCLCVGWCVDACMKCPSLV